MQRASEFCAEQGSSKKMSDVIFTRLSSLIQKTVGIKMPPIKRTMLEGRIRKRLVALHMASFEEYCEYLFATMHQGEEMVQLIDVVTTNKTDFFREQNHFTLLPALLDTCIKPNRTPIRLWSAGCSTGEEPYTLAIVAQEWSQKHALYPFKITATDISTAVLRKAHAGVYHADSIEAIPLDLKKKYFLRHKKKDVPQVKVCSQLQNTVQFMRLNLITDKFTFQQVFHIIFCRNVMIYFSKETQENLIERFYSVLIDKGYLFLGHSEALHGMDKRFRTLKPTVYQKK